MAKSRLLEQIGPSDKVFLTHQKMFPWRAILHEEKFMHLPGGKKVHPVWGIFNLKLKKWKGPVNEWVDDYWQRYVLTTFPSQDEAEEAALLYAAQHSECIGHLEAQLLSFTVSGPQQKHS